MTKKYVLQSSIRRSETLGNTGSKKGVWDFPGGPVAKTLHSLKKESALSYTLL